MSNITGDGESLSSENYTEGGGGGGGGGGVGEEVQQQLLHRPSADVQPTQPPVKKKRNLPGMPDPTAEVIALSPSTLMATNRFVCEICNKGFQRDQNLQLHRRGHNLPWKLRQRAATAEARKRVYVCPEPSCVHHNPSRALGDLTGIKKHFCRKHGEKRWKCDKCSKRYAVQSDWKAHSKTCGTREYKCDCGTIFSRRDSFITHRAFCDALAEETNKPTAGNHAPSGLQPPALPASAAMGPEISIADFSHAHHASLVHAKPSSFPGAAPSVFSLPSSSLHLSPSSAGPATAAFDGMKSVVSAAAHMSATALLQKAAQMGATASGAAAASSACMAGSDMRAYNPAVAAAYDGDGLGIMDGGNGYVNGGHGHGQFFDGPGAVGQGRFLKGLEQGMHARSSSNSVMTVDFMGVGGKPRPVPAGLQHQFRHQQQLSAHGQSNGSVLMDKSMWGDV